MTEPDQMALGGISLQLASNASFITAAIDIVGGVAGGAASVAAGQPLDTVKVKLQAFPKLYSGAMSCFVKTYKQQGLFHGLYAGSVPALIAQVAENATLFLCYGLCQKSMLSLTGKKSAADLNNIQNALCGSGAAVFTAFALCPTELIKCRLQAMHELRQTGQDAGNVCKNKKLIGPFGLTKHILKEEGFRGMFRGLRPTLAREVPGYFFFFGGYELSRSLLVPEGQSKEDIGPLKTILCGGLGGVAFWLSVHPVDVVKSRVQVALNVASHRQMKGTLATIYSIFRNEGFTALYRGMTPNLIRTFWATGALFLAYEYTKKGLTSLSQCR